MYSNKLNRGIKYIDARTQSFFLESPFVMYAELNAPHHTLHFHAYYQNEVAIYIFELIELLSGSLHRCQQRLVEAWAELHQTKLLVDWQRLQEGRKPLLIVPLK